MSPERGELLSRREAAQRAGVHINTLISWERNGLIQTRRVRVKGKHETRIPAVELHRFIRTQTRAYRRAVAETQPDAERRRVRTPRSADDSAEPDGRIARRLRLLGSRRREAEPIDERQLRRERQSAARAVRRERQAMTEVEAQRRAREEAERRADAAESQLRSHRDVMARERRELESEATALRGELDKRTREIEGRARELDEAAAQADRQTAAANQLRAEAEEHRTKVRAELAEEMGDLRAQREELERRAEALSGERTSNGASAS